MGLASVPLLRDVTPASDSAVSLRWFFKVDVEDGHCDRFARVLASHRARSKLARKTLAP